MRPYSRDTWLSDPDPLHAGGSSPVEGDFRIDQWLIQPQLNTIVLPDNSTVQLEPKVMEVLVYLADRAGEVVSKKSLLQALWGDTFVTENALTRCIAELRKAFQDDAEEPKIIQTIPKKGYRLIASVSKLKAPASRYQILEKLGQGGEWAKSAAPTTTGWSGTSPSTFCPLTWPEARQHWHVSSARRRPPPCFPIRTS